MANAYLKKEERKNLSAQEGFSASQNCSNDEEDIVSSFLSLEAEKTRLTEQKEHLTVLLDQLEIKAKEVVEKRKRKVERLDSEISDLKRRCEKFTSLINSESTQECGQAEP